MKRFFLLAAVIFALFAAVAAWGASLPELQVVEASASLDVDADSVFDALDDVSTYPDWSHHVPDTAELAFGERTGAGATAAWSGAGVGSLEILQSVPPELVLVNLQDGDASTVLTYALMEEGGKTLVVAREESELGGFPYLARVRAKLTEGSEATEMQTSLERLGARLQP